MHILDGIRTGHLQTERETASTNSRSEYSKWFKWITRIVRRLGPWLIVASVEHPADQSSGSSRCPLTPERGVRRPARMKARPPANTHRRHPTEKSAGSRRLPSRRPGRTSFKVQSGCPLPDAVPEGVTNRRPTIREAARCDPCACRRVRVCRMIRFCF